MKRILVVRPGALGDTVLTLPLLHSIRRWESAAAARRAPRGVTISAPVEITFIGSRAYADILPEYIRFSAFDAAANLWMFGAGDLPDRPSYDRAYVILNSPDQVVARLRESGVPLIKTARSKPEPGRHVVECMHEALGLPISTPGDYLTDPRALREGPIWLHPGSGGPSKTLPLSLFARVSTELMNQLHRPAVLTCSRQDSFLFDRPEWIELSSHPHITCMRDASFGELRDALGRAALFVGNDSGPAHLAGAWGAPVIVFFMNTDPGQWAPWVTPSRRLILDMRLECLHNTDAALERFRARAAAWLPMVVSPCP